MKPSLRFSICSLWLLIFSDCVNRVGLLNIYGVFSCRYVFGAFAGIPVVLQKHAHVERSSLGQTQHSAAAITTHLQCRMVSTVQDRQVSRLVRGAVFFIWICCAASELLQKMAAGFVPPAFVEAKDENVHTTRHFRWNFIRMSSKVVHSSVVLPKNSKREWTIQTPHHHHGARVPLFLSPDAYLQLLVAQWENKS